MERWIEERKALGTKLKEIRTQKGISTYEVIMNGKINGKQLASIEQGNANYTIMALLGYLKGVKININFEDIET